jgi:hypothetical protein
VLRLLLTAKAQFYLSLGMLLGAVVGWPLSALTWARDEPQFVLGLSWLALIIGSYNTIITAQVHGETDVVVSGDDAGEQPA